MSTIQNLKNFIRHGKQARHGEPTTNVSPVHAQQQRAPQNHYGVSEPNVAEHRQYQTNAAPGGGYSVAAGGDNRNVVAQAGGAAAKAAGDKQKKDTSGTTKRDKELDATALEQIIAEERENKGKLPNYPGLERWTLLEKMGDGAFSNVYRAKDNSGQYGEVAIKAVRKFEMSQSQVSNIPSMAHTPFLLLSFLYMHPIPPYDKTTSFAYPPTSGATLGRQTSASRF